VAHNLTQHVKSRVPPGLAGSIVYGSYVPITGPGSTEIDQPLGFGPTGREPDDRRVVIEPVLLPSANDRL
jgi:hypothetical protein